MATLPTLFPVSSFQLNPDWTDESGGSTDLHLHVDETGSGDTAYIRSAVDLSSIALRFGLTDTPSDFGSMDSLQIEIRHGRGGAEGGDNGGGDDTWRLTAWVRDFVGGVTLAGVSLAGGEMDVEVSTAGYLAKTETIAFPFVNTSATKEQWDRAELELDAFYTQNMGKDADRIWVDFARLVNGVYTPGAPEALLAGSAAGSSTATATLTGEVPLAATAAGSSTGAALLSGEVPLAATADGASSGLGNLTVEVASADVLLAGTADGSSTADGILTGEVPLAGAAAGGSTGQAVLTGEVPLATTADGSSTADADLTILGSVLLAGTSGGSSTAGASLSVDVALNGTSDGSSTSTGDLTIAGLIALSGAASGTSTAGGDLTVENLNVQLAGTSAGTSAGTGTLILTVGIVGDATGTSSALGALTLDSDPPPRRWLEARRRFNRGREGHGLGRGGEGSSVSIGLEGSSI